MTSSPEFLPITSALVRGASYRERRELFEKFGPLPGIDQWLDIDAPECRPVSYLPWKLASIMGGPIYKPFTELNNK